MTSFENTEITFKHWCQQNDVQIMVLSTYSDMFDIAGIDAVIEYKRQIRTVQFRCRNRSDYQDVTVRCKSRIMPENILYKIQNVAWFIYITPYWWVILDTSFYEHLMPIRPQPSSNADGSQFEAYPIAELRPYIVDSFGLQPFSKSLMEAF